MKVGDKLYRVIEYDPPDKAPHTWKVGETEITHISTKQLRLANASKVGFYRIRFDPSIIGKYLHTSRAEALRAFERRCHDEIESLAKRVNDAGRALAWAKEQANATAS